jgi:hypothetical protein
VERDIAVSGLSSVEMALSDVSSYRSRRDFWVLDVSCQDSILEQKWTPFPKPFRRFESRMHVTMVRQRDLSWQIKKTRIGFAFQRVRVVLLLRRRDAMMMIMMIAMQSPLSIHQSPNCLNNMTCQRDSTMCRIDSFATL